MATPTRVPLGASTLNRKYQIDVNTGTVASPTWVGVFGIMDFVPNLDPNLVDDSDFDSGGYKSSTVTALAHSEVFTVARKTQATSPTAYDPGQEFLRLASLTQGISNSVNYRFYEMTPGGPRTEAYSAQAAVTWSPKGGDMASDDQVGVTLTGQGARTAIAHPDTTTVPIITSISPNTAGTAGGAQLSIHGAYFTTATAVKAAAATIATANWVLVNDGLILVTAPAESAGTTGFTVITPAGTSNSVNVTYS